MISLGEELLGILNIINTKLNLSKTSFKYFQVNALFSVFFPFLDND